MTLIFQSLISVLDNLWIYVMTAAMLCLSTLTVTRLSVKLVSLQRHWHSICPCMNIHVNDPADEWGRCLCRVLCWFVVDSVTPSESRAGVSCSIQGWSHDSCPSSSSLNTGSQGPARASSLNLIVCSC